MTSNGKGGFFVFWGWLALALCPLQAQTARLVQGGTLIDGTGAPPLEQAAILIQGDRIAAVGRMGEVEAPAGAQIIDVEGLYILPGLIDAHIHSRAWDNELFLAHGVTTVGDLGNLTEWIMAQKDGLNRGKIRGPRMLASGSSIRGPYPSERSFARFHHIVVNSRAEAVREARKRIEAGADIIKVYDGLTRDMLEGIIAEARRANLPVAGHTANAWEAIEVGYDMIVHTPGVARACLEEGREIGEEDPHAHMSFDRADRLIESMVAKGVYLNPTLRSAWNWAYRDEYQYEDFQLLFNNKNLRYIPLNFRLGILREYNRIGMYALQDLPPAFEAMKRQAHRNAVEFVKRFVRGGGKVVLGSDTLSTQGLGLHQELQILVDYAGLSPAQALSTVTRHPAEMYRITDRLGTVERGKLADLLVVEGNPLENIRNTRNVRMVFKAGGVVDTAYHPDYRNPIPKSTPEDTGHLIPSPVIEEIEPKAITQGQAGATITVTGSGFTRYTLVHFRDHRLVPTFVSPFELRVELPLELVEEVGTVPIRVSNVPGPVGTISAGGQTALRHLGPRDETSNEAYLVVRFR